MESGIPVWLALLLLVPLWCWDPTSQKRGREHAFLVTSRVEFLDGRGRTVVLEKGYRLRVGSADAPLGWWEEEIEPHIRSGALVKDPGPH